MSESPFAVDITPDWRAFVRCIQRKGTPTRVHHIELFLDQEVQDTICDRFELLEGLDAEDPYYPLQRNVRIQRFLGYDYVNCRVEDLEVPLNRMTTDDTAVLRRESGRSYMNEHRGPITNWHEFESYPWPDPAAVSTRALTWYEEHLPEDMCVIGRSCHFAQYLTWLMGYETLCYALYDQRDLVQAISERLIELFRVILAQMLQFERVKIIWGSDDMGFKTGTLISPDDLREFALPGHKLMAEMSHRAGRPYLLHSCGNLGTIMEDLLSDVQLDGLHSFEDTISPVTEMKQQYGDRVALLGGIDVDFMCRATEEQVRARVRDTLDVCLPGGGYCLGTGNSVANYIPVDNYLAMLDEGRRYAT